ncbi:nitroreductase family deazaflavin-dependent oxidoreductase [Mycobacterium sp.]|uniref:nitroreductase family deazaflavin-dependent oxidoreductase n=1 Tax=Mycobacterium sp. TaxID=1785 RepID=UPI003F97CBE2
MSQVLDIVRVLNKHVGNPAMMPMSGRKHYFASVIEHTGRRSGKHYATPVVTDRTADGFIVGLPYGTEVDWLRNVLAAGRATIRCGGQTYDVVGPQVIDAASAKPLLSAKYRRRFGWLPIANYVKFNSAPSPSAEGKGEGGSARNTG